MGKPVAHCGLCAQTLPIGSTALDHVPVCPRVEGACSTCKSGDHRQHLLGICVACPCEWRPPKAPAPLSEREKALIAYVKVLEDEITASRMVIRLLPDQMPKLREMRDALKANGVLL